MERERKITYNEKILRDVDLALTTLTHIEKALRTLKSEIIEIQKEVVSSNEEKKDMD